MAKIDGTSDLLAALRSQLAGRTGKSGAAGSSPTRTSGDTELTANRAVAPEVLQRRIGGELKSVDLLAAGGKKRARQIFLESVLAWDLGEDLLTDGQFGHLIRDVEASISADPKLSEQLDKLLVQIKNESNSNT